MTTLYQSNEDKGNIYSAVEKPEQKNGNIENRKDSSISSPSSQEFKVWRQRFQEITSQMRQAKDLDVLLKITVAQVKEKIAGDRALIYQFTTSDHGTVLAEARNSGWTPSLGENLPAILFGLYTDQDYLEAVSIDNIAQIQTTPYQKQLLEKFQVQGSLSLPIFIENQVWGLLVIHSCESERKWQEAEITLISQISTEITYRLQSFELQKELQQSVLAKQSVGKVISKILQQPNVNKIFETTTQEIRQLLKCDRVGVYRFEPDWSGKFVFESVGVGWTKVVTPDYKMVWEDTHLQETKGGRYAKGETFVVNDTYKIGLAQCHIDILEQFEAKAYIIAPIFSGEQLWGLLAAYQNTGPRKWQDWEVSFLNQVGLQFGVAVSQGEYADEITQIAKQEKALINVVNRIQQASNLTEIFKNTTLEIRQALQCDRVSIYRFNEDWSGNFIAESVAAGWVKLVGADINTLVEDTYFQETKGARFAKGETLAVDDIYLANISPCYLELLETFEAKAYINVPIFFENKLWGLLAVYQNDEPRKWRKSEVTFLSQIASQLKLAKSQIDYTNELAQKAEQEKTINNIVNRIRQSSNLTEIFKNTIQEARQALKCDRVSIYRFNEDWSGNFIAESVAAGWVKLVGTDINTLVEDTYFQETKGARFAKGETLAVNNIYKEKITPCYLELLETFEAKAYINVPIFFDDKLWGLLAAYQNNGAREWKESEVNFLSQIASQFNIAKSQIDYTKDLAQRAEQERTIRSIVNRIREAVDTEEIFNTTTQEVRLALKCDRVAVYEFAPDWGGKFVNESVGAGWTKLVGPNIKTVLDDTYLQDTKGGRYAKGETFIVNDTYKIGLADCHIAILEQFEAKSYIIVPIFYGEKLWGLLAAYQNTGPREWRESEVTFLQQIALQFSLAKSQLDNVEQLQIQSQEIQKVVEQEKTLTKIVNRVRQSFDLEEIIKVVTQEVRQSLKCDRVGVYEFAPDWSGRFIAEAVGSDWIKVATPDFQMVWEDTHLQETQGGRYAKGESFVVNDIYQAGHAQCHVEILEQIQAKAYMIVPIFYGEKLWGLLAAYQNTGTRKWLTREVNFLEQVGLQISVAKSQIDYVEQIQSKSEELAQIAEQEKTFTKIVNRIRQSNDVEEIFSVTTQELRKILKCDRTVVYQFTSDWGGEFVAESVASGWVKLVGPGFKTPLNDPCLQNAKGGRYEKGDTLVIEDIYKSTLDPCYIEIIEKYEARGYIIAPILIADKLWGLVAAYQNSGPRQWEETEIKLLSRLGDQLGLALQQAQYLEQLQNQSSQLSEAAEREKAAKELLQTRSIQLLRAISPALSGDLTVRAPITEDELGTIADAYNGTLQALQQIVVQVQTSSEKVAQTSVNSNSSLMGLTNLAKNQSDEIAKALNELQQMVDSTQAVVSNAQQVQMAVQQANKTVDAGDNAMNETVNAIQAIRETVAQTGKKIKRLSESSQKISKVVNLISNFATQTNVLALNAAIEATRAGEYGKGFAVVADEVRSLSRQSSAATIEIEKLVEEIQTETGEVAVAMETGIQQVVEGTNLVNSTRQTLNEIVAATEEISELIERITEATQIQMQQSETVTASMNDVAGIANKTFGESQEIAAVFQNLSEMAQDLLSTAGKFKVK
jgi:methyl-accepting chemotaxis protein PixJ